MKNTFEWGCIASNINIVLTLYFSMTSDNMISFRAAVCDHRRCGHSDLLIPVQIKLIKCNDIHCFRRRDRINKIIIYR